MELTMRKWHQGERYNNGWRIALDRFMNDWDYDKVLAEAKSLWAIYHNALRRLDARTREINAILEAREGIQT